LAELKATYIQQWPSNRIAWFSFS